MSLGRRKDERQEEMFCTSLDLPKSPGHPFYKKLNELLREAGFDRWVEELCAPYFAEDKGRPSIPPGTYFRMIFIGHFEGIASQRGIAWRCSDSRSLAEFLGYGPTEETPDHSSLTRLHQRLAQSVHEEVFEFVLKLAAQKGLLVGKTVGIDSTTLEANAAMKSIVRKDTGAEYKEYLRTLAQLTGLENPSDQELRRFDRKRKDKTCSNDDWESPSDPDARIAKMKDGTTHLAYKAEHAVDLESELIVSARVTAADEADSATVADSAADAKQNVESVRDEDILKEVVADKGYHSAESLSQLQQMDLRTYVAEPDSPHGRVWTNKPPEYQEAVYGNRRRIRGDRGKQLQRQRSEKTERSFAHVCQTGGARRCWLRGLITVAKRYLIQVAARNLSTIMRLLFGIGTPRGLQSAAALSPLFLFCLLRALSWLWTLRLPTGTRISTSSRERFEERARDTILTANRENACFSTG